VTSVGGRWAVLMNPIDAGDGWCCWAGVRRAKTVVEPWPQLGGCGGGGGLLAWAGCGGDSSSRRGGGGRDGVANYW